MNRIVLITGASSGYGKAAAKAFADCGDTVIMAARNEERAGIPSLWPPATKNGCKPPAGR